MKERKIGDKVRIKSSGEEVRFLYYYGDKGLVVKSKNGKTYLLLNEIGDVFPQWYKNLVNWFKRTIFTGK